jgi:YCII-related domain-containing protein
MGQRCRFRVPPFVYGVIPPTKETRTMTSFMLLYDGPPTTPDASHEGWPEWFQGLGDTLVDMGSPMIAGFVVRADGTTSDTAAGLNGYSVVRAEDRDAVLDLLRDHPFLAGGSDYRIAVYEVPAKSA